MRDLEFSTIADAASGDDLAMIDVLQACERPVYNIALRFVTNPVDAEDAAQDAMLKIFRNLGSFKGNSAFSSWVYRLTFNACMDFLRKQSRAPRTVDDENALLNVRDYSISVDEQYERSADAELVRIAISKLEEHHRQAIILCDYNGLSYAEIAEVMQTSIGTVKSRINRARKALMKSLQQMEMF